MCLLRVGLSEQDITFDEPLRHTSVCVRVDTCPLLCRSAHPTSAAERQILGSKETGGGEGKGLMVSTNLAGQQRGL